MKTVAGDVEACAAAWIIKRRDSDRWSGEDERTLNLWLDESWAHRVTYWRLDAVWDRADRLGVLYPSRPVRGRFRPTFLKIAAGLAFVAMIGTGAAYWTTRPTMKTYATSIGGRELVSFADGTKIELNTDTVLRANMTTTARTVWLDRGEAYFQVRHDAAHPFVVMVGRQRITDLGTKFLIRRDAGQLKVALVEGSVRLAAAKPEATLKRGDEAIVSANSFSVAKKTAKELANELSWRRGFLVFRHTTLADVATEFNRYNLQKIVIGDAAAAETTIDGTFLTNDPGAFTDAAQTVFGLRVQNRGNLIVVSR
ncbi:MAG TPA: FecR domain-containing protein [Rhizomicrobium sp.]|nr:FecR domain-containing protein [Rhizomicrobium sp.]